MAKANNTAIEQLIQWMEAPSGKPEDIIVEMMAKIKDLRKIERQQIENAYNSARNYPNSYFDAQHYYFMEYIDND